MGDGGGPFSAVLALAGWSLRELWWAYLALGGTATEDQLRDHLANRTPLEAVEHEVLAHALNDRLADLGQDERVPYRPSANGDR